MAKNTGKVREFCESGKVGTLLQLCDRTHDHWLCIDVYFKAILDLPMPVCKIARRPSRMFQ